MSEWCPRSYRKTDREQGRSRQASLSCGHELVVSENVPLANTHTTLQKRDAETQSSSVLESREGCRGTQATVCHHLQKPRLKSLHGHRVSRFHTHSCNVRSNGDPLRLKENVVHHSQPFYFSFFQLFSFQFLLFLVYRFNSSVFEMLLCVLQFFKMLRVIVRFFVETIFIQTMFSCLAVQLVTHGEVGI